MSKATKQSPHTSNDDPYYILAASSLADERNRVLKHGHTFAVFDHYGDIRPDGLCEQGLYHEGTRFLSCCVLGLGQDRPLFLSSTIKEDNALLAVDLTNPDIASGGEIMIPRGTLHFSRIKFLWQGACYERLLIMNYGLAPVEFQFSLHLEADFVDIFEVRGTRRSRRGQGLPVHIEDDQLILAYRGLDEVVRRCRLTFLPRPASLSPREVTFRMRLRPKEQESVHIIVACEAGIASGALPFEQAETAAAAALPAARADSTSIITSKQHFNDWLNRTAADLHMMTTATPQGPYPFAGVPWFSTPFGRDGIITALECLWLNPSLARGVLAYLASTQALERIPEQDAEPGKILHETRTGEMAALGEIPFGRYYGSVDATPLFVLLACAYYERTADRPFLESIWSNVEAALNWIDNSGDVDGDGFVEYSRRSCAGLDNQGWKDSQDSIFHRNGNLADGPIALCEVQGYVYAAKKAAAEAATALGHDGRATQLVQQAERLRSRFLEAFWCDDLDTFALALDGSKRPCRVRTSNAGHCLLTGIASDEQARRLARTLLAPGSFSGWGVRTVAASEARYNPMSYHNGSIWPHDNALIAFGLARYGLMNEVVQLMSGIFDASLFVDLHRLPELFCGFARRAGEGPTLYPVACAPQSWAAASVFLLLQACLGLTVNAPRARVCFSFPVLPPFLKEIQIHNLQVGDAVIDLFLLRHGNDVGINVLRREGEVEITMVK
jgi:glycogen debranching enzyme